MSNVISLDSHRPHRQGEAHCLGCRHSWHAVALEGVVVLTCPECLSDKGIFSGIVGPSEGDQVWACNCENTFFQRIAGKGWACTQCGAIQNGINDDPEPNSPSPLFGQ